MIKVTISTDKDKNKTIIELLRNIFHDIRADAFKPFVLGLIEYHQHGINCKKITDNQLIETLFVIRTYLVRRRVLKLTQGENKEIPRLCKHIAEKEALLNDAKTHILKLLSKGIYRLRFPNDYDIESELKRIDFYNGLRKYSKLILGKIEEFISKVSVDFRDTKITIEHVMPQSVNESEEWKQEIGIDWERVHKTYLHREAQPWKATTPNGSKHGATNT